MNQELVEAIELNPFAASVNYYASRIGEHPKIENTLSAKGLSIIEGITGFGDRTIGKQLPSNRNKAGRELRGKLTELGILKPSGHETFRGYATLPLSDIDGKVTGIFGHKVDAKMEGRPAITIGDGLFNVSALSRFDEIIICPNILDAWAFIAAGHENVIAISEGEQLKKEQIPDAVRRLYLCGVDDDAEAFDGRERLSIGVPDAMTIHDLVIDRINDRDLLARRIRSATWIAGSSVDEHAPSVAPEPGRPPATTPTVDLPLDETDDGLVAVIEHRRWRVQALERNTRPGSMRISLMVTDTRTRAMHVDTLDLYHARSRRAFLAAAVEETALSDTTLKADLGRLLLRLEQHQHEQRKTPEKTSIPEMTESERSEAINLLQNENLLDRILDDFEACGIVGEQSGKLAGYLAATSRLLDKPLGLVIQSSSAAGKTALSDSVLAFMPPESRFACTSMTSQSLYYLGDQDLRHKILSVAEEEGVRDASYQLKLLQSEGSLSLISTTKRSGDGRTTTERYDVQGPVALVMTTTSLKVDPELMNRCLVINVDESPAQTAAIQSAFGRSLTLDGWNRKDDRDRVVNLHRNAQRLLRPLKIVNPFGDQLKFICEQPRHRRDFTKYVALIEAVTLLHQYQREVKQRERNGITEDYIEVTRRDIAMANRIADWALGRSIDELAGPTRRLLISLHDWLAERSRKRGVPVFELTFNRREAREALGLSATPMRIHLERLCYHEYVVPHGTGGAGRLSRYSLLYDGRGREGQPTMTGLIDAGKLVDPGETAPTTTNLTSEKAT